ncbi:putative codeine 3-O-demethylase [Helianthus annuus]|uniref:Codeine 3-O-demethylase n=1 Tax=Helianthus annuus TaxID=4232 RepID=A0A251TQL6_HELAN|nr:protein SRG1 [Helianthus annuus]KAF5788222.1 putative codeine 3-O-demethylase [Helianthus annuus]KAJ0515295.1 putative codeine 3-O-demethylase [Helianthus annuus]KAJ0523761.1 putative codeine 3-O-demethylase [Helianthus annuus]KAJ0531490.1 putative codeine 3-O-demethylase [Helianthus annuus]KAJ0698330.1 putative codeine 3-O-demethylase [Helianthus annuus]
MASVDSLPEKTPYQMAIDGDQPSSKYMINNNNYTKFGSLETSPPFAPVPIIDVGCFVSSSKQDDQQAELDKLRSALTTWGCFQAVNHGLSESYLDIVRQVSKQFLELPLEEKKKYYREAGSSEGYGNDVTVSESQVQDWCDRLFLLLLPKDQRKLQFWPENPSNFRETLDDYTMKIKSISVVIFEAMAKSLGLEENCFSKQFSEEHEVMSARFLLYPPCPTPDQVLGLKAHSDKSGITFLLQDPEVEGLQVFNDGKWYMVPVIRDALFINLGDQMQILSNGIFKSPLHRVVTNKGKGRISVAMFIEPDPNKEIGPVDVLVDEKTPRMYKTVKNYAVFNYESFQKGINVPLDDVKV